MAAQASTISSPDVFISYASEDLPFVLRLATDLAAAGVRPWVDKFDLMPGQDWDLAIRDAIGACRYFLVVLSAHSVNKKGYFQEEVRQALDIAVKYPEGRVFIIPVRLDDCEPSFARLRRLHNADLFPNYERGLQDLLRVFYYAKQEARGGFTVVSPTVSGRVIRLTERGFGFITPFDGTSDVFFHHSEVRNASFAEVHEGDEVRFTLVQGRLGKFGRSVLVLRSAMPAVEARQSELGAIAPPVPSEQTGWLARLFRRK